MKSSAAQAEQAEKSANKSLILMQIILMKWNCAFQRPCFYATAISTGCFTPSAQNGFCGIPAVPHHAFYRVQRTVRCARQRDSRRAADGKKEYQIHRLRFFALERRDRT